MVTGPSFKLGIVDPDSVSRAGIRWILREKEILEDFSVTWEAEGYGEALTECERSCPDLVIISVQYYTHNLVSFIQDLPHRFSTILTLLIAPPPDDLNVSDELIGAGLDGYLEYNQANDSLWYAINALLRNNYWFSKSFVSDTSVIQHGNTVKGLSGKEQQVLELMLRGFSNGQIAAALGISERTVRYHLTNICNKLGASSRTQVILRALTGNWSN